MSCDDSVVFRGGSPVFLPQSGVNFHLHPHCSFPPLLTVTHCSIFPFSVPSCTHSMYYLDLQQHIQTFSQLIMSSKGIHTIYVFLFCSFPSLFFSPQWDDGSKLKSLSTLSISQSIITVSLRTLNIMW